MVDLLADLDDPALRRWFDSGAIGRGALVFERGCVERMEVVARSAGRVQLSGLVWGTAPVPYDVRLDVQGRESASRQVNGYCSCPMRWNCKHVVALIHAARLAEQPSALPAWQRRLAGFLDEIEAEDDQRPSPLGLVVELRSHVATRGYGYRPLSGPIVQLRPVRRGARDNWVKTGVGWSDLAYSSYSTAGFDRGQVEVLAAMYAAASRSHYAARAAAIDLADVGRSAWSLLEQAQAAGVVLVPGNEVSMVVLAAQPVVISADVTSSGGDLALQVRPSDEPWRSATELSVVGEPGHGLVGRVVDDQGSATLVLGRLERPLTHGLRALLESKDAVAVPATDRSAFVHDYLPRLARGVSVSSSDETVVVPDPVTPALVVRVSWRGVARAVLRWVWRYRVAADEARDFDLSSSERDGVRQIRDEIEITDRVLSRWESAERSLLVHERSGAILPDVMVGPGQVLALVERVLPALRACPEVEVEEDSAPPDFRAAQGDLEVRFDALSAEPATRSGPADSDPVDSDPGEAPTDWLDLAVVISIEGEQLPLTTVLEALTRGQERIFLPSGLHVAADHPQLARLAQLVQAAGEIADRPAEGVRVGRSDLGLWGELAELGVVDQQAAEWVRAARALGHLDGLPDVVPKGLACELRPYQLAGFRWLALLWASGLGGILADDMGLGKTLQALALISHARLEGAAPFLVVAPTSVVAAWQQEAAAHTPDLVVRAVTATGKRRGGSLADALKDADVLVTSYSLLRLEADEYAGLTWGGLVLDEAQAIKNHQGKTYHAARRIDAPFRLAMTGTPFENRMLELWAILSVAAPGLYPWPQKFVQNVANPVERGGDERALARFRSRIRPFLLRRTKEVVAADLPVKQEQVLDVSLAGPHRRLYDTRLQRERQKVLGLVEDFERNRIAIFGSLTRLRQMSLHAGLVDEKHLAVASAKIDLLVEHLHELAEEGHRALVFSSFTSFLGLVRVRLEREGIGASYLDGRTRDRARVIAGFRSGSDPAFLISLKAGGVGLTLTEADYVFVLDPWWNPAAEAQAVDRAHRIGQHRPVFVYRLIATDTIEEKVRALAERKAALFKQVVGGEGGVASAIDAADVRALFS